jgi:pyruvate/2-oxoglutarate dehydrogenase complex dihydrolipoamide dehydrogenase (E3) component
MKANNVKINMCLLPKEITDDGVISVDQEGNEREFKADSVIICRGFLPDKSMTDALRGKVNEVIPIGDCVEARKFYDAIHEGWVAGNQIMT